VAEGFSGVEYRLGVVLGAKVGLLRGSGRSVDDILKDSDWTSRPNLLALPHDRETLKCFVVPPQPTTLIDSTARETLAQQLHDRYRPKSLKDALADRREYWEWEHLDETFKKSNRASIDHIETKLRALGYMIVPRAPDEPLSFKFSDAELATLCEMEHGRWVAERLLEGWKLAPERDNRRMLRPNLIAWGDLSDEEKKKDLDIVTLITEQLHQVGYKIVSASLAPTP